MKRILAILIIATIILGCDKPESEMPELEQEMPSKADEENNTININIGDWYNDGQPL